MLADWVLPSPDHPIVRLEGDFTPSYPVGPAGDPGGALRAPAIELVRVAKELGKLDELAARVEALKLERRRPGRSLRARPAGAAGPDPGRPRR